MAVWLLLLPSPLDAFVLSMAATRSSRKQLERGGSKPSFGLGTAVHYQNSMDTSIDLDTTTTTTTTTNLYRPRHDKSTLPDPAHVQFVSCEEYAADDTNLDTEEYNNYNDDDETAGHYPFAAMMQGSAPYIAAHSHKVAVFHVPGDLAYDNDDHLFSDMALAWLLGLKIVMVVGCRYDAEGCSVSSSSSGDDDDDLSLWQEHECYNALRVTSAAMLRKVEEEAGVLRGEVERKLNRLLRMHGGSHHQHDGVGGDEGNVMSGNFFTAKLFGTVRGQDFENTGYCSAVHAENIRNVLDNNDVVLLTTVGLSKTGELVHTNGYHLAASAAVALQADKLIYMANQGSVLEHNQVPMQELPLSFARDMIDYHAVKVHKTGFATFEQARQRLEPGAVELLIHLAWGSWALEQGVNRAHIVNPTDGALLEELFSSKNGVNTCLYRDDEDDANGDDDLIAQEDWDGFFNAAAQGQAIFMT